MKNLIVLALLIIPIYTEAQDNKFALEGNNDIETVQILGGGSLGGKIEIKNDNDDPQVHLFGDGSILAGLQFDYGQIQLDGVSVADFNNNTDGRFQAMISLHNEKDESVKYSIGLFDRYSINDLPEEFSTTNLAFSHQGSIISRITPSGQYFQISDRRLKNNIEDINTVLPRLRGVRTVSYFPFNSTSEEYGFLAQDLQKYFPVLVDQMQSETQDTYMVNYNGMIPILVKAIQEQQNRIDVLEAELEKVKRG